MTGRDRKNYCLNRCYQAYYDKLPSFLKTDSPLKYFGLFMAVLANPALNSITNLTPGRVDVLVTTASDGKRRAYNADYDNLLYTLKVFHDLNYSVDEIRIVGTDIFLYKKLPDLVSDLLRLTKFKKTVLVIEGYHLPGAKALEVMCNHGVSALISNNSPVKDELTAEFDEREIEYDFFDPGSCDYSNRPVTMFVEGKLFRCPKTAYGYAQGNETDPGLYLDTVERKLEINQLKYAMFDFTNSDPSEKCAECSIKTDPRE